MAGTARRLMAGSPLRVCYFGAYRDEYSRNRIMIEGLRRNGVAVQICHETLWHGIEDRVQATAGGWRRPAFLCRVLRSYARLAWRGLRLHGHYDVMVVGYPGQFDVLLARLLTWLHGTRLAWDIFMSIYLIALERGLDRSSPGTVAFLRRAEWLAVRLPDALILDTAAYATWFEQTHGVPAARFGLVPTGADSTLFAPGPVEDRAEDNEPAPEHTSVPFRVLYYGTYIPNHGVPTIITAALHLADDPSIEFELVGDGPDRATVAAFARAYGLSNVRFVDWLAPEQLRARIAQADLCLGAFGTTPQSLMTVQNKIYEGLAMRKPVLTGDGPAVRQALQHGEQLYLCPRADAAALAQAIRTLRADPALCARLAAQGHAAFLAHFTVEHLGARFRELLTSLE